jgi:hypothetical protein
MRRILVLLTMLCGACSERAFVVTGTPEIRLDTHLLDFGILSLGTSHRMPLRISNAGSVRAEIVLRGNGPSTQSPMTFSLSAGETHVSFIDFRAESLGQMNDSLVLTLDGQSIDVVQITGLGIPPCLSSVCHQSTFDLGTRTCIERALDDSSSCNTGCIQAGSGQCQAGTCVGQLTTRCDDHNACTSDVCMQSGECVHQVNTVNIIDSCLVYSCDPLRGVMSEPVEDGTNCGETTCRTTHICLAGQCTQAPTGNQENDCLYENVSHSGMCFSTKSKKMKCFMSVDGGPVQLSVVSGASDVAQPISSEVYLDSMGLMKPNNVFAPLPNVPMKKVSSGRDGYAGLTQSGALLRVSSFESSNVVIDGGVIDYCGYGWTEQAVLEQPDSDGGRITHCSWNGMSRTADYMYTREDQPDVHLIDGSQLFFKGSQLFSWGSYFLAHRLVLAFPFEPTAFSTGSACAISNAGVAMCFGSLPGSRTSPVPNEPIELAGPFHQVGPLTQGQTIYEAYDYIVADGGHVAEGESTLQPNVISVNIESASRNCILSSGVILCDRFDGKYVERVRGMKSLHDNCGIDANNNMVCPSLGAIPAFRVPDVFEGSSSSCWFSRGDGGVDCVSHYFPDGGWTQTKPVIHAPLPQPISFRTTNYAGGCVISVGQVHCFNANMNAIMPKRIDVPFPVRLVSGSLWRGCSVTGLNAINCWGGIPEYQKRIVAKKPVTQIWVGERHSCALLEDSSALCWGANFNGQLGIAPWSGKTLSTIP